MHLWNPKECVLLACLSQEAGKARRTFARVPLVDASLLLLAFMEATSAQHRGRSIRKPAPTKPRLPDTTMHWEFRHGSLQCNLPRPVGHQMHGKRNLQNGSLGVASLHRYIMQHASTYLSLAQKQCLNLRTRGQLWAHLSIFLMKNRFLCAGQKPTPYINSDAHASDTQDVICTAASQFPFSIHPQERRTTQV